MQKYFHSLFTFFTDDR